MSGPAMRLALAVLLLVANVGGSHGDDSDLRRRGEALATRLCAGCHAIGADDRSPQVGAPAFRRLDRRLNLDTFMGRLRQGLTSGHPDMPTFRFTPDDARGLIAYLRSL
jgi:mono/diheme cytochrome c family protein